MNHSTVAGLSRPIAVKSTPIMLWQGFGACRLCRPRSPATFLVMQRSVPSKCMLNTRKIMQHTDQICRAHPGGTPPGGGKQIWSVCCIILRVFSMYFDGTLFCVTKNVAGERGLHSQHAPHPCQSMIGVDFSAMGRLRPATVASLGTDGAGRLACQVASMKVACPVGQGCLSMRLLRVV